MNNFVMIYTTLFAVAAVCLMAFAVFAIGFLIGYKTEEKKILKRNMQHETKELQENENEKKAKKEWKKFLEYDGSIPEGY